jgi:hypothetical protein
MPRKLRPLFVRSFNDAVLTTQFISRRFLIVTAPNLAFLLYKLSVYNLLYLGDFIFSHLVRQKLQEEAN